jgi:fumarate hydratase subunit beta
MSQRRIEAPLSEETVKDLRAGDAVSLSGTVYTARDAAHKRLVELIREEKPLPFDLTGSVIYYVGPSPAKPGAVIGAAGPTTSIRMDPYAPVLLERGVRGMIGKGFRSKDVVESMKEHGAVYFGATGGAAALISKAIVEAEVIAFDELGPEAVRRLKVVDMPLIVINDCYGNDQYVGGQKRWAL